MTTMTPLALLGLPLGWLLPTGLLAALLLGYLGAPVMAWASSGALWLVLAGAGPGWLIAYGAVALVAVVRPLRTLLVSTPILRAMKALGFLPTISDTERQAIEAGTTWMDAELFSGKPDWARLMGQPWPELSEAEQAFVDGPVARLCAMTDDWDVDRRRDLPTEVWQALKDEGFFGLIIPEAYGGKGFSASANSAIVARLSSRSMPLGISVMVPNSLGPAELLVHYGTEAQKAHYLPRLARGEEMPAFALTEPGAGSDAGSITSSGVLFRGDDGELMLRLNWDKRYITLAAVSTVLGLAFQLHDPENLLGRGEHLGITCALIPTGTPGVELGRRHDPMGVAFINSPTRGHDVVVPADAIIGGLDGAGRGWRMLMECLAAGRGISLPASSTAGAQKCARVAGAYAAVRKQFGTEIGKFEGVAEPLARIAGTAYLLEAARHYTNTGLDGGAKPAVVTAMAKYSFTELARDVINDAMDVVGGAGISKGPRNLLAGTYAGTPISITVEGANILTRTLVVFGQGAIRCHPFVQEEIAAADDGDGSRFDRAFWGHVGHVVRNASRALVLSATRGRLAASPVSGPAAEYHRRLSWASASFAFLADVSMAGLGANLKRRESVTGRFADIFCWLYLGTAVLRRFEAEGRRSEDVPLMRWSLELACARMQQAFDGLYRNLDLPGLGWLLAGPVATWSRLNSLGHGPDDELGAAVARALQVPGAQRDRLTPCVQRVPDDEDALERLEITFVLCVESAGVLRRIKDAVRLGKLPRARPVELLDQAVEAGIVEPDDADLVRRAEAAREDAIQVDSFTIAEYLRSAVLPAEPRSAGDDPHATRGAAAPAGTATDEPSSRSDDLTPAEDHGS